MGDGHPRSSGSSRVPAVVDPAWLAGRGEDAAVVHLDVSLDGRDPRDTSPPVATPRVSWTHDLHEPLRRAFVGRPRFEALMDRCGIRGDDHVLVSGEHPALAASAYWVMRQHGHDRLSLLLPRPASGCEPRGGASGGRRRRAGPGGYRAGPTVDGIRVSRDELLARFVGAPAGTAVVDARSRGEFRGRVEHPLDLPWEWHRVAGHVPGAVNLPAAALLDPVGSLLPVDRLRELVGATGLALEEGPEVVVYCRTGIESGLLWFVLSEVLGHASTRVYDGGWAEYGSLADVPVAR